MDVGGVRLGEVEVRGETLAPPPSISQRYRLEAIATATTAAAATEATAAGTFFTGLGFIDRQGTAAMFLAVEGGDRGLSLGIAAHLDKAETLGAAAVTIHDDLRAGDRAVRPEQLFESCTVNIVAQITDIQFFTHDLSFDFGQATRFLLSRSG